MQSQTGTGGGRGVLGRGAILIMGLWLSACVAGTVAPTATPGAPTVVPGTPSATPGAPPSGATPVVLNSGPLVVTITAPEDEAVVNAPRVDVAGQAPAETVISIGDSITVVEASGQFSISVPLQEGPNALEIVASDPDGNQASVTLVVTYEPGS